MKSLTFSSHTSGAKVKHQGPPGTAEAQSLIIIITFKIIIYRTVFQLHHDSRKPKMVDRGVTKINVSLPPLLS